MTPEEKEKIDYKIEAKRKAKDREINEWTKAIFLGFIFFIVMYEILINI